MDNVDIKELFRFCRTKIKIFIIITVITTAIGIFYSVFFQKPIYSSYATIILNGNESTSTITATDISINKSLIDTYTEVIKSRRVLEQAIQKLEINDTYEELVKKIKVTDVNDAEIIKITVKYSSPAEAKKIANTIAVLFTKEVTTLFNINNVSILDEAIQNEKPSNINYPLQILISIFSGLLLSLIITFLMYSLDTTVKSSEQVEQRIKLSVLGKIRELHGNFKTDLVVSEKPKSVVSEDIRTIRTNIQLGLSNKKTKIILITSSTPSEGKSFVSSNLALAFAQAGKRTVLIDCDLRKGRLHHSFNTTNETGLSTILSSTAKDNPLIMHEKKENLYVIPRGPVPTNPSELLTGNKFKAIISYLKDNFEYIILDGTPTQGLPDALILASISDYSLIVCSNNQTKLDVLNSTKKSLQGVNSKIAGVIINRIRDTDSGYYSGYYGNYKK